MDIAIFISAITTIVIAIFAHFNSINNLKEKNHLIQLEVEKLKAKDENQQQIIDMLKKHVLDKLIYNPNAVEKLVEVIDKGGNDGK